MNLWFKLKSIVALGMIEVSMVALYRLLIKLHIHPVCRIKGEISSQIFFGASRLPKLELPSVSSWNSNGNLFGNIDISLDKSPPTWQANPLTRIKSQFHSAPWWEISDFEEKTGDIKIIWEMSRMDWVIAFAQRARNGDIKSLDRLNAWLVHWLESNPPFLGINWKCGQEASIRVINLCCATLILGQENDSLPGLKDMIRLHLKRIAPTIHYAIAQNNNHGTSEAAALFIGGSWLAASGDLDGKKYEKLGRKWLEDRASKLLEEDGSFSQYSLNYHRMVLDTFSIAEVWLRRLNLQHFSSDFYNSVSKATSWLFQMISPVSGDGPNIGANDGSLLLKLTDSSYRDFRPCVQLSANLFIKHRAYENNDLCDSHLAWMGLDNEESKNLNYINCDYDSGGYKILRSNDATVIFRFPKFRYRPSQADAMHVDFWINGKNILVDAGSYSYNSIPDLSGYFNGTASHNTIQFDDRDQMPRLSRFLFGNWLKTKQVSPILANDSLMSTSACYQDYKGAEHFRQVDLKEHNLKIFDKVNGFKKKAIIRWRLMDSEWIFEKTKDGVQVSNETSKLTISADVPISRAEIVAGWKSLYYMQKQSVSVLEVEVNRAGKIISEFSWVS